jgi:hypothetical protein
MNTYRFSLKRFCNKLKRENIKDEEILIFTHQMAKKYYKIHVPFLFLYLGYSYNIIKNPDYPTYMKNTFIAFSSIISLSLLGLFLYSNRHISSIKLKKQSKVLIIETFRYFGMRKKNYEVPLSNIKEIRGISKYIRTKRTGIFIIKPNINVFKIFNLFFIRPYKNNPEFDKIFKRLLK